MIRNPDHKAWDADVMARHRQWGVNVPAVDVDGVLVEYDMGVPCALIELKHEQAKPVRVSDPNIVALTTLASARSYEIPMYVTRFRRDPWEFSVSPFNPSAERFLQGSRRFDERGYVHFLHAVRGRQASDEMLRRIGL